jgi:hypothetical protein
MPPRPRTNKSPTLSESAMYCHLFVALHLPRFACRLRLFDFQRMRKCITIFHFLLRVTRDTVIRLCFANFIWLRNMCQLLGMNCNVPTDIVFSFTGFATRGGQTDHHSDGWGIAFFEGSGVRHFVDYQFRHRVAGGGTDPALPDQVKKRHRAYPQGHARPGCIAKLSSICAGIVGTLLGFRS